MRQRALKPDYLAPTIFHINYVALLHMGIKVLAYGVENTLLLPGRTCLDPQTEALLIKMHREGFIICLVTSRKRDYQRMVEPFEGKVVQSSGFGKKPDLKFFLSILGIMGVKPEEVAMIGDRLLLDTTPANREGMVTVLVTPLGRDRLLQRVAGQRRRERRALRRFGISRPHISS